MVSSAATMPSVNWEGKTECVCVYLVITVRSLNGLSTFKLQFEIGQPRCPENHMAWGEECIHWRVSKALKQLNWLLLPQDPSYYFSLIYVLVSPMVSFHQALPLNHMHNSPFPHTYQMHRPTHSSGLYHPHSIRWGVLRIKLLIM
jgi:hypothetical protein